MLGLVNGDEGIFDGDPTVFAELSEGASDSFARGADHGGHLLVGEQEGEAEFAVFEMLADLMG